MSNIDVYNCAADILEQVASKFGGSVSGSGISDSRFQTFLDLDGATLNLDLGVVEQDSNFSFRLVYDAGSSVNSNSNNIDFALTVSFPMLSFPVDDNDKMIVGETMHSLYIQELGKVLKQDYGITNDNLIMMVYTDYVVTSGIVYGDWLYQYKDDRSCNQIANSMIKSLVALQSRLQDVIDAYSNRYL